MNETYIRRQLKLKTLDIPMSDDIQSYHNDFVNLYESLGELEKIEDSEDIHWCNEHQEIFTYDKNSHEFWITPVFDEYMKTKHNLSMLDSRLLINLFLENMFILEVKTYNIIDDNSYDDLFVID